MIKNICRKLLKPDIVRIYFWIGFSIELLIVAANMGEFKISREPRLFQVACLFFCIKIFLTKYTRKEWIMIFIFGLLGIISYLFTRDLFLFRIVVMVLAAKDVSSQSAIKGVFYVMLGALIIYMILSISGVLGVLEITADYGRNKVETRYCFGGKHPNLFHASIWILFMLGIFTYFEKIKWFHFCIITIINYVAFLFTASRTGLIIGLFVVALSMVLKFSKRARESKFLYIFGIGAMVCCLITSILLAHYGTTLPLFEKLNGVFTGRITMVYNQVRESKLLLFAGQNNWITTEIGYIKLFYSFGLIASIIYLLLIILLLRQSYQLKNYKNLIILIPIICVTFIEGYTVLNYIARDFIILLLFCNWNKLILKNGESNKSESIKS